MRSLHRDVPSDECTARMVSVWCMLQLNDCVLAHQCTLVEVKHSVLLSVLHCHWRRPFLKVMQTPLPPHSATWGWL